MATNSQLMDHNYIKLIGLHRAEFERAKADKAHAWKLQVSVALFACISVLLPKQTVTYMTTVLALIAIGFNWFFSWRSRRRHRLAERARRILLLMKGLGWRISGKEMADLLASFSVSESEGRHWEDENYFDYIGEPSPKALAAIIQESTFFSKHLYSLSAKRYWSYSVLFLSLFFIILLAIPSIPSYQWSIIIVRLVCTALVCLVAIDIVGTAIAFSEAAHIVSGIDDRLANIMLSGSSESDVISVFGDYNATIQGAPLIPTGIYKQHRERLRRLWEKRHKTPYA